MRANRGRLALLKVRVSRTARYSTAEGPTATTVLQADAPHWELWRLQTPFPNQQGLPWNDRRLQPALPHALPVLAGRGGLRPSALAPQTAHAPSSWRLGSASPGRLCSRVESAPARSLWGFSTSASPPPDAPWGLRARRDHVHQHRLQWAL